MAEKKKRRSVGQDAMIGAIGGVAGGMANATLTHPFDTHMTMRQTGRKLSYPLWKAPLHKDMWEGVGSSAFKKGVGFGIGLGTTFAVSNILRKLLDTKSQPSISKLGFHKSK
jgi:hypothetical protein